MVSNAAESRQTDEKGDTAGPVHGMEKTAPASSCDIHGPEMPVSGMTIGVQSATSLPSHTN